ncbi:solute carrier family 25 (mitochondrial folate transporter) member 32 protein [Dioscorea alata]|uniref:Solute carrier family 25 (Mitochondrial folate transporter) member 32 protein n=1 Tax=Dioscorea alata TaxID=55571 RepID=A0ACB7URH3_DIOAL|nr:solute carrier family 25 (mitochondrial folate transporter) member 32 protein [Dioscorea alata]
MPLLDALNWKWENATAGAVAGFSTVAILHPLDVVRTRFQVNDGRLANLPSYKNTGHAIYTIARTEGIRGLYAGFFPAVFGSSVSWGLYFFLYARAKSRYSKGSDEPLSAGYHLISAAEAGSLVCLFTNPIWLVKTRLQLQPSLHQNRPYSGFYDALRTILKEEGWHAFFRGAAPGLILVSHGAIQFTIYEELRKLAIHFKRNKRTENSDGDILNSFDFATIGAMSKIAAMMLTYPYQVIRARLQQRPNCDGTPKYLDSWHVMRETARFEGIRGFYRGMTPNLLKNIPAASITFVVYENLLSLLQRQER